MSHEGGCKGRALFGECDLVNDVSIYIGIQANSRPRIRSRSSALIIRLISVILGWTVFSNEVAIL